MSDHMTHVMMIRIYSEFRGLSIRHTFEKYILDRFDSQQPLLNFGTLLISSPEPTSNETLKRKEWQRHIKAQGAALHSFRDISWFHKGISQQNVYKGISQQNVYKGISQQNVHKGISKQCS